MNPKIKNLFNGFQFIEDTGILIGRLPDEIFDEVKSWVEKCKEIKDNPYGYLREHINVGRNSYQISVPAPYIENSYVLAYLNYLGEYYLMSQDNKLKHEDIFRRVTLRKYTGHFDGYDFWINFAYKGDVNPMHNHAGNLSAVLYVQNDGLPTIFENGIQFTGGDGDIILFPAHLMHEVKEKTVDSERITISFNLITNQ